MPHGARLFAKRDVNVICPLCSMENAKGRSRVILNAAFP